ncbi:MAG: hypothetical protein KZQ64_09335 [gamma proteobacterium symbiont of Bathyaustriella thionipta]|nr:hypothetical protein [gamma proteobacterium symbiont of Bathyaustriella thionipta]MCU7949475.1 hypothetical protein [gamma proteobacterium symbiont of Bathyaustriella thionipta]MCU7953577.1 hypothetical protein [gamma proteobacterium symbiont of Bathyaustriella thionipta]MCU7955933.1 hypothetical protein [gamma proteobacterium symbiont of Bathyaustriella thionipta]MCU7967726.1 hypothetical protein [gamma proteobacterium symbiont of Bathyaustriella thionipta]
MLDWTDEGHYHWLISQWSALEKDYYKIPNIDYQTWKQAHRSYKIIGIDSEQDQLQQT